MKALIPAAGLGTRWYPWSKIVPKELLPMGRYPAIHYVLEEAVAAGIRENGIIISKAKKLIKAYVENVWQTQRPETRVVWFYQYSARGVADALLCAKEWVQDEPTAVLYPDEIHPSEGGIIQLCRAYEGSPGCRRGQLVSTYKRIVPRPDYPASIVPWNNYARLRVRFKYTPCDTRRIKTELTGRIRKILRNCSMFLIERDFKFQE